MNFQSLADEAKRIWRKIPAKYQGGIVFITAAAITAIGKTLSAAFLDTDQPCFHWACIRHGVASSIAAGVAAGTAAARTFFMRPGPGPRPAPPEFCKYCNCRIEDHIVTPNGLRCPVQPQSVLEAH